MDKYPSYGDIVVGIIQIGKEHGNYRHTGVTVIGLVTLAIS